MGNAVAACCDSSDSGKNELTVGDQSKYTMDAPTKTGLTKDEKVDDPSQSARAFYVSSPEPKD